MTVRDTFFMRRLLAALTIIALVLGTSTFFPREASAAQVVILTAGSTWSVPADWNSSMNTIEVIGGGGGGGQVANFGGGGGGGGGYSRIDNLTLTPGASITIQIGTGGGQETAGGDTFFNRTAGSAGTCADTVSVCAKGGGAGADNVAGTGGAAASGVGTVKNNGGTGGAGHTGDGSGGGGGAGGPRGVGGTGGAGSVLNGGGGGGGGGGGNGNDGAIGGNNFNGFGGGGVNSVGTAGGGAGGGTNGVAGPAGGAGSLEWFSAGSGGGGGGGGNAAAGGGGGAYGGGGGGGETTGASGAQGVIVITYEASGSHTQVNFTKDVVVLGSVQVVGAVSKGSGTFVIDHPLRPRTHLLYHSFVESPDAKNVYDGIATLDERGEAVIKLPDYFLALNSDYRYLATGISGPMPDLHLKRGVRREWFVGDPSLIIAGGVPNGRVSWQVTGIRKDPLIRAHPIVPEVEKGPDEIVGKGECIFEPLCEL